MVRKDKIKNSRKTLISVIIPAYKQEKTIVKDMLRIEKVLKQLRYDYEMIVVVDGMDDKTYDRAIKLASKNVKTFGYETNHGKGYAIRYGMVRSKGNIVGFIDSGMDIIPNGLSMLLEHFEWYNADIIIGSKRHKNSKVTYPTSRKIISIMSQLFIHALFGLNVKDTQVGMKFFRREVLENVFPRLLVKRFAFDIEILAVAYYLGYRKVIEAPIELKYNFASSIVSQDLFKAVMHTLWDTLAIFYRLRILRYYDNASKRKWKFDPELDFKVNIG